MYPEFPNHKIVKAPYSGNISNCLEYDFPMVFPYGWMNCTQLFLVFFSSKSAFGKFGYYGKRSSLGCYFAFTAMHKPNIIG